MQGFEKLQVLKDKMLAPLFEKRRHLGCSMCGTTFYGYYQKQGYGPKVPNGKTRPHPTKAGWRIVETYDDVYYPNCPDCLTPMFIDDAKSAKASYDSMMEDFRKRDERAAARKAKRDAQPVICSRRLRFDNWASFQERLTHLSDNPDDITPNEMLCSYFLDKLFWKRFGKGCHTIECRHWIIRKQLHDETYMSNSGKTRMGEFIPFFDVTNTITGKQRKVGHDHVVSYIKMKEKFRPNRRNDPKRNFGLPNSRGYR